MPDDDTTTLAQQLDELDESTLQRLVSDAIARRRKVSGREFGLAEAERRFGKQVDSQTGRA